MGFRVWGLGVSGLGFSGGLGLGFRVWGSWSRVWAVHGLGYRVLGSGFRV